MDEGSVRIAQVLVPEKRKIVGQRVAGSAGPRGVTAPHGPIAVSGKGRAGNGEQDEQGRKSDCLHSQLPSTFCCRGLAQGRGKAEESHVQAAHQLSPQHVKCCCPATQPPYHSGPSIQDSCLERCATASSPAPPIRSSSAAEGDCFARGSPAVAVLNCQPLPKFHFPTDTGGDREMCHGFVTRTFHLFQVGSERGCFTRGG